MHTVYLKIALHSDSLANDIDEMDMYDYIEFKVQPNNKSIIISSLKPQKHSKQAQIDHRRNKSIYSWKIAFILYN